MERRHHIIMGAIAAVCLSACALSASATEAPGVSAPAPIEDVSPPPPHVPAVPGPGSLIALAIGLVLMPPRRRGR